MTHHECTSDVVLFITGVPCSGKTTICSKIHNFLIERIVEEKLKDLDAPFRISRVSYFSFDEFCPAKNYLTTDINPTLAQNHRENTRVDAENYLNCQQQFKDHILSLIHI